MATKTVRCNKASQCHNELCHHRIAHNYEESTCISETCFYFHEPVKCVPYDHKPREGKTK